VTYVYGFDHEHDGPPMALKELLGGKGANLAEMTSVLHLPVPTVSTRGWPPTWRASRRRWARASATATTPCS
jgi:hypothetical protein